MFSGCKAGFTPDDIVVPEEWVRTFGGYGDDMAIATAMDNSGNMFITGVFNGGADFDPGPAEDIRGASGSQDIFLTKYDSHGEYQWVRAWGTDTSIPEAFPVWDDVANGVVTDVSGNVYVAGGYADEDFEPGEVYETIDADCFLRKFDPNGALQWERQWGGDHQDSCGGAAIDSDGNIYLTGYTEGLLDLDPGEGEAIFGAENTYNTFVSKLNQDGEFIWGFVFDTYFGLLNNFTVTDSGGLYISGRYQNTADFMPGPGVAELTSNGSYDAFLCCFTIDGDFQWCLGWGSDDWDYLPYISCDTVGNVYITASYKGVIDLNPGPGVELQGSADKWGTYLMKLTSNRDFQWVKGWDSSDRMESRCIRIDGNDIYVSGYFSGTGDFLPGPGEWDLPAEDYNIYLSKFDTDGEFQWAYNWNVGSGFEYSKGITVSQEGYIYITGNFFVPVDSYPAPLKGSIPPSAYYDVFLLRYPPYAEL
jgi:hypothetical protein